MKEHSLTFSFIRLLLSSVYFYYWNLYIDTNSYEQWRANIHQQLEEDLQRQVEELLNETDQQERLTRLRQRYIRYENLSKLSLLLLEKR
jgi:hypothetical protein